MFLSLVIDEIRWFNPEKKIYHKNKKTENNG